MPKYPLNALGADEFERMCQALLKEVIGAGTTTFGAGKDGAREATFVGEAEYPSSVDRWSGKWIFQVKFHDTELLGTDKARKQVLSDLDEELDKIVNKYKHTCNNYILLTNVPLTGTAGTGNIDRIQTEIAPRYAHAVPNIHVLGADDICRILDNYPAIRRTYRHLLVAGDVIDALLRKQASELDEASLTLRIYFDTSFKRDLNAQLDQAGDVTDEPVRLQDVFMDLEVSMTGTHEAYDPALVKAFIEISFEDGFIEAEAVRALLSESLPRVVLIGGPGEGKSTVVQYLCQVHRARLLGDDSAVALNESYEPTQPRIPFRIILKEYGQWITNQSASEAKQDLSIDRYLSDQVEQISSRSFSVENLHYIARTNPLLLCLDGLDEVTEPQLRETLMQNVDEFIRRMDEVLKADLHVVATTRPTGYTDQFNPQKYLHLTLNSLNAEKVSNYVERWTTAKMLAVEKRERIASIMDICLADGQISLLTKTPLQVTILLLIISAGGTPPRQREALFNEYLEVIYKREKSKGGSVIASEKELLLGLHKYIGYLLHDASATGKTSAVLARPEYDDAVGQFLAFMNPYEHANKRKTEVAAITHDAGERLVLVVESPADSFGFELRSIQEFFAASHLTDTATDTAQRFERFEAICRLSHWRNVTLFFGGRVGRIYPGEAANVIEVCKDIDRGNEDEYVRRGSILALELVADRAFGPNGRLQRSLVEYGLSILDMPLARPLQSAVGELLERASKEDIDEHIVPVLNNRIDLVSADVLRGYIGTISRVPALSESLKHAVDVLLANHPGNETSVLEAIIESRFQQDWAAKALQAVTSKIEDDFVVNILSSQTKGNWSQVRHFLELFATTSQLDRTYELLNLVLLRGLFTRALVNSPAGSSPQVTNDPGILGVLDCMQAVGLLVRGTTLVSQNQMRFDSSVVRRALELVSPDVLAGNVDAYISRLGIPQGLAGLFWLLHISEGSPTRDTVVQFRRWLASAANDESFQRLVKYFGRNRSPQLLLLLSSLDDAGLCSEAECDSSLLLFSGAPENLELRRSLDSLRTLVGKVSPRAQDLVSRFGLCTLDATTRARVLETTATWPIPSAIRVLQYFFFSRPQSRRTTTLTLSAAEALLILDSVDAVVSNFEIDQTLASVVNCKLRLSDQLSARLAQTLIQLTGNEGVATQSLVNLFIRTYEVGEPPADLQTAILNRLATSPVDYIPMRQIDRSVRSTCLTSLLTLTDSPDASICRGAHRLIRAICSHDSLIQAPQRLLVKSSAALGHRQDHLFQANSLDSHRTAIALYAVRSLKSDAEWRSFTERFSSTTDGLELDDWFSVLPEVQRNNATFANWPILVWEVVAKRPPSETDPRLIEMLRAIVDDRPQVLSSIAPQLGLPLALP